MAGVSLVDIVQGNPVAWAQQSNPALYDNGTGGATPAINFNNGNVQKIVLGANATPTFTNPVAGAFYLLFLIQDGTGSRTVTWPAAVKWMVDLLAPVLQTAPAAVDIVGFYYDGTSYWGEFLSNTKIFDNGNSGAAKTIDFNNGDNQKFTLSANTTLTLSNPVAGRRYRLLITQDGTGGRTITWPAAVKFPNAIPPVALAASLSYIIELYYDGANYQTMFNQGINIFNAGNSSTAITIDWNNNRTQLVTMTGNCTFTLNNPVIGEVYRLKLLQDGTGTRTYTWPASVKWPGAVAPTGSGANKVDMITLIWDGTNYFGSSSLNY